MEEKRYYPSFMNGVLMCVAYIIMSGVLGVTGIVLDKYQISEHIIYSCNFIFVPLVSMGIIIYYVRQKNGGGLKVYVGRKVSRVSLYVFLLLTSFGFFIVINEVDNLIREVVDTKIYIEIMRQALGGNIILVLVALVIIPALLEELFFRGIILRGFLEHYSPRMAIFLSALLFGVIHLNVTQMVSGLLLGIFFGWVYIKSRSLYPVIFLHGFHNLMVVVLYRLFPGPEYVELTEEVVHQPPGITLSGVLLAVLGIYFFTSGLENSE
ncbi:MAG: CPBP family intramembrane glutamic endopeptidase [Halanaerobiaceae bacterium]